MKQQYFKAGEKVKGKYFGVSFSGVVTECHPHTVHPTRVEHFIKLDNEITVLGTARNSVIVATFDPKEAEVGNELMAA